MWRGDRSVRRLAVVLAVALTLTLTLQGHAGEMIADFETGAYGWSGANSEHETGYAAEGGQGSLRLKAGGVAAVDGSRFAWSRHTHLGFYLFFPPGASNGEVRVIIREHDARNRVETWTVLVKPDWLGWRFVLLPLGKAPFAPMGGDRQWNPAPTPNSTGVLTLGFENRTDQDSVYLDQVLLTLPGAAAADLIFPAGDVNDKELDLVLPGPLGELPLSARLRNADPKSSYLVLAGGLGTSGKVPAMAEKQRVANRGILLFPEAPLDRGKTYTLFVVPKITTGDVGQVDVVTLRIAPKLAPHADPIGQPPVRVHARR